MPTKRPLPPRPQMQVKKPATAVSTAAVFDKLVRMLDLLEQTKLNALLKEVRATGRHAAAIHTLLETLMPTIDELTQKLTALQTAVDAAEQRADDRDAALQTKLDALQAAYDALVASGANVPQAVLDQMQASIDDLNAFAAPSGGETPINPTP